MKPLGWLGWLWSLQDAKGHNHNKGPSKRAFTRVLKRGERGKARRLISKLTE